MSEMGGSYDPGPWRGYDYKSARKAYAGPSTKAFDSDAGRGYSGKAGKSIDDLVPKKLTTNAKSPLVIITDGTGSMGQFPEVIFKKLPLLDLGIEDYLENPEISVAMVGDAGASDAYPLQVQEFTKGKGLVKTLNKLIIEGGGGGNEEESYDLAALYYSRNVEMPKATKPTLIWICDEGIYHSVNKDWGEKYSRVSIDGSLKSAALFEELKKMYSVYCIRKHYNDQVNGDKMVGANARIHEQWQQYLGSDRIAVLNDPTRVVDVIFGILAKETGKMDFFKKEITYRQKPDQIDTVMKSIAAMKPGTMPKGTSKLLRDPTKSKGSKALGEA